MLITKDFKDVTKEALKGISEKMSNFDRYKAIEKNQKKLIAECEKGGKLRCSVVEVLSGTKYYLFIYDRIKDVRLVYAPPSSIGSFGGDIDNWMWPRHAGDFSFSGLTWDQTGVRLNMMRRTCLTSPKSIFRFPSRDIKKAHIR